MPATTNHAIYFANGSSPDELDTVSTTMAGSIDTAITNESNAIKDELRGTGTTFPSNAVDGQMFWRTDNGIGYRYFGDEWLPVEGRLPFASALLDIPTFGSITQTLKDLPFTVDKDETHPGSLNAAGRFVAPVKGYYRFDCWLAYWKPDDEAIVTLRAHWSGGSVEEVSRGYKDSGLYGAYIVALNQGQWFQFRVQRNMSGTSPIASTNSGSHFLASFVRPA